MSDDGETAGHRRRRYIPNSAPDPVASPSMGSCGTTPCLAARIRRCRSFRVPVDSGQDTEVTPRRPLPISAATTPLEDDDLLIEILLRLPPQPSSLPRASLVCKRWRRLISDPQFLVRFRTHHRKAPLLGFFSCDVGSNDVEFTSSLDSPERNPAPRLHLRLDDRIGWLILDCRHGRLLLFNWKQQHLLVWDPITGDQHRVALSLLLDCKERVLGQGGIICAAGDQGHVHGGCHSSPFQAFLIGVNIISIRVFASVYSSEAGTWGNPISTEFKQEWQDEGRVIVNRRNTLVGNSICWLFTGGPCSIVEFDLGRQSLSFIGVPLDSFGVGESLDTECLFSIMPVDGCEIGLVILSGFSALVLKKKTNSDGVAGWVLRNTIELKSPLMLQPGVDMSPPLILGLAEDDNIMFLLADGGAVFMVHLDSMQFKKLSGKMNFQFCFPFTSFFTGAVAPSA